MDIKTDIRYLKGVGEKRAELFQKLGIKTVGDLLEFYPRLYEDWSKITPISKTFLGENACIRGIVTYNPEESRIRKGLTVYKTGVTDGDEVLKLTIFNNKYAAEALKEGEEYLFFGKVGGNIFNREMTNPAFVKAEGGDRIRPVYRSTQMLSSKIIEKTVRTALDGMKEITEDALPYSVREKYSLCAVDYAYENIHFPKSDYDLSAARKRLIFEELLVLQMGLILLRGRNRKKTGYIINENYTEEFCNLLPFSLTSAQRRAIAEAVEDMKKSTPMNRLVQGDVGSGKTAVAAAIIYNAAKNGFQSALMAPTEILATQHYNTLKKLLENTGIEVGLLTGAVTASQKKKIKEKLKNGETSLIIGTHALIQKDVEFKKLGLVITDEQHRFGVEQRGSLSGKGENPHTLVMSATPIPRTLALMIYGDLDVSVLDELPPGRQVTETYKIGSDKRERAFNYVKKHLDKGLQAYFVCPLVEEGETELASAEEEAEKLKSGFFRDYSVGLIHGKMKPKEKDEIMEKFSSGEIQILVSTTVIEVGVDVPNAVIMVIENAERFGLSQLHQLRGRVGRGKEKSTCILISDAENEEAVSRLSVMCKTADGFKIADEDLKLRGPGDFFGARQHGLPEMKIADMLKDVKVVAQAQSAAKEILKNDPKLTSAENRGLRKKIISLFDSSSPKAFN